MVDKQKPILVAKDALHVWTVNVADATCPSSDGSLAVLSSQELARAQRFRRPKDRLLFTQAHVAVRQTLSRYASIPPEGWIFDIGEHGRPEIGNTDAPDDLRFNLSHTPGMIAIVVNGSFDAGVDVEGIGRVDDVAAMSRTCFAAPERLALLALPHAEQPLRFTQIWALKESFIKALGTGLTTPLHSFSFDVSIPGSIRFDCSADIDVDPSAWSFSLSKPTSSHVLATASRQCPGRDASPRRFYR